MPRQDLEHLKLLSIFHYVAGGLVGFFSCFPLLYVGLGLFFVIGPPTSGNAPPPPPALGWLFVILGTVASLCGWCLAVCLLFAAHFLAQHRHYIFCLVVAGLSCLWMPLGTVLGVFTIVVLARPSVKQLFAEPVVLEVEPDQ